MTLGIYAPSETLTCPLGLEAGEAQRSDETSLGARKRAPASAVLTTTVTVMCGTEKHRVRVSDRGAIAFLDHSPREIANLVTLRALGDQTCACLNLRAWLVAKKPDKRFEGVRDRWRATTLLRKKRREERASAKSVVLPRATFREKDLAKRKVLLREEWLRYVLDTVPNRIGRPFANVFEPQEIVYGLGATTTVEAYFLPVYIDPNVAEARRPGTRVWKFAKVGLRVSLRPSWVSAFRSGLGVFNSRFVLGYERTRPNEVLARIACPVLSKPSDPRDPATPEVQIVSRRLVRVGVASYALRAGEEPLP